jgi:rare lipoprotein A
MTRPPYRGRHRHPRTHRPARYAAAGLIAVAGIAPHSAGVRPAARTAPRPRPVTRLAARPAPVRAAPVRWVTRTVTGQVLRGRATWYGPGFAGRLTADGHVFDPSADLTAAHRWLPFGTRLRVCRPARCVVVTIDDRGPFGDAILDLSYAAAVRLDMVGTGIAPVTATVLTTRRVRVSA